MKTLVLSKLPHTWLIDIDGTILRHNGYIEEGDKLLPGVKDFWNLIPSQDTIILLSARPEIERAPTLAFVERHGLRVDNAIFGLPKGERVLINDVKPRGLETAVALNLPRDQGLGGLDLVTSEK
jgi:hypothetical protein